MNSVLLLPTFDRPELFKRFVKSYGDTGATIDSLALVDKEDPSYLEYKALELPASWTLVTTDARTMGAKIREVWAKIKGRDSVMILNDDHLCVTHEWDKKTYANLNGKNFVSTNDRWMAPIKAAGVTAFSMPLVEAWGFPLFPAGINHLFIDDVWESIGRQTGCHDIDMSIVVLHLHVLKREGKLDKTHQSVYTPNWQLGPSRVAFDRFMKEELPGVIERTSALQLTKPKEVTNA